MLIKRLLVLPLLGILAGGAWVLGSAVVPQTPTEMRKAADAEARKGNFKDAYQVYHKLAIDPADDAGRVSHDLLQGIICLTQLGRRDEADDFREAAVAAHGRNWRLLQSAAQSYLSGETYGTIVAGKFYRGNRRGNDGRRVYTLERDRVRALQLMRQALDEVAKEPAGEERGKFYFALADMLLDNRFGQGAWQLQSLTDLSKLPDYQEGYPAYMYGGETRGAPVNADGSLVLHTVPKSWKEAATDGQRWRWSLTKASETSKLAARQPTMTPSQTRAARMPCARWRRMRLSRVWLMASNDSSFPRNSISSTSCRRWPIPARSRGVSARSILWDRYSKTASSTTAPRSIGERTSSNSAPASKTGSPNGSIRSLATGPVLSHWAPSRRGKTPSRTCSSATASM